jgi:hypothetical protein
VSLHTFNRNGNHFRIGLRRFQPDQFHTSLVELLDIARLGIVVAKEVCRITKPQWPWPLFEQGGGEFGNLRCNVRTQSQQAARTTLFKLEQLSLVSFSQPQGEDIHILKARGNHFLKPPAKKHRQQALF